MKRFVLEQTLSRPAIFGIYLGFFIIQVVPIVLKELIGSYSTLSLELKNGVSHIKRSYWIYMVALAVIQLSKFCLDRLFLMGFAKISLRTELFKLSIYLSLVFTYIVYPLMIILLGATFGDWSDQLSANYSGAQIFVGLLIPAAWTAVSTLGGISVWTELSSRNTCPSRSVLGTLRPSAELICYAAWNLSLLENSLLLFTNFHRTRSGAAISAVLDLVVVAALSNYIHRFVFWDRQMSSNYLSWSFVAIGVKMISTFIDFYIVFSPNASNKPFFELALLTCCLLQRLGTSLASRNFRINVWDTTLDFSSRYAGMLLMVDSLAGSNSKDLEMQLYYQGMMQACPTLCKKHRVETPNKVTAAETHPRRFVVSLVTVGRDKKATLQAKDTHASTEHPKEQRSETMSWWDRFKSSKSSKMKAREGFELAKNADQYLPDEGSLGHSQAKTSGESNQKTLTLDEVYDSLIEYARVHLDQTDERVWQLLLLLHMHRGFPSLVLLSRLLQRLESRALKRGISAQLEYYNFRKLYETKLDALYKGTVAEGEQPTMHSVWDIYCTLNLEETVGEWDGGVASSKKNRTTGESDDQIELAKVPKIQRIAALGDESNLAEPNWPFDQLKYYNMVVSKVLKLTDTRRALFSNLQGDKIIRSSFVYSCNRQSIKYHSQVKKDFQIFAANPAQFASYVYPMFIYYFSLIRNSPRLSKSILSAYKSKLLSIASQIKRKPKFEDVDWIQASCVSLQVSMDMKDIGVVLSASLNYADHLGQEPEEVPLVGKNISTLLPSELASKHKSAMLKCQELELLDIHRRPFFLIGLDSELKSTQGVVKILPCLSKRITAVSLLNFQYNPGSSLVLVEKDMSILHAEKRFWDALQDQPVDSLEELSSDFLIALKLFAFLVGKNMAHLKEGTGSASHRQPKFPTIDQLFRGVHLKSMLTSDIGECLHSWATQLYKSLQEFWHSNEAKGLAFGIPTDSPYWGVFEDDQIVGGFEWNPQSSICSDVYKVYLRIVRVHTKQTDKKRQQTEVAPGQQLSKPPASGLGLALLKQASNSMIEASPQVPTKQGENLIKEQALSSLGSISPRAPRAGGTPYPQPRARGPWKLQAEDSLMQQGTAASKEREDLESPLQSERVQVDASRPGSAKAIPAVSSNPQESANPGLLPEGGSSDETEESQMKTDSRVSVWADGHLVDQTGSEINRGTSFRKLLADLFEVVVSVETTASTRLGLLETIGTEDSQKLMILQSDISQWLEVIKEIRSAILPDQFSAVQVAQFEQLNHPIGLVDFKKSPSPQAVNSGELQSVTTSRLEDPMIAHLKSATQLPGLATESIKPELPSRKRTDTSSKPKIKLVSTEKVHTAKTRFMDEYKAMQTRPKRDQLIAKPDLPQESGHNREHRGNTNFIGNILNKVMVGKI